MNDILKHNLQFCNNLAVYESFIITDTNLQRSERPVVSISGGSDSDIMLDIIATLDNEKKVKYIFFDTGIEYQATKEHLDVLEKKYGITIERVRAKTPVPLGCRKYGLPFWSKYVSEMIERLQRYDFKWEDKPFDELIKEYPKCTAALRWWCNAFAEKVGKDGQTVKSKFNINYIRGLKEFMLASPPTFKISNKCCKGAKKDNAKDYLKKHEADLNMVGIRKAEGGARATAYKTCFDNAKSGETWDNYRPIFWYTDNDKEYCEEYLGVTHSDCYCKYGLKRTGCAGCPFGKDFENELKVIEEHEPKLYKAVNNIFGASYEYTRAFMQFRAEINKKNNQANGQMNLFELV